MAQGKCEVEDRGNKVDPLACEAISIKSLALFLLVFFFTWGKLESEQGRWLGGDSVYKCQQALAAPRTVPNIPNKAENRVSEVKLILISSANCALNGFSLLTTQG